MISIILFALATGEVGWVPMSQSDCQHVVTAVEQGMNVGVTRNDGIRFNVIEAQCMEKDDATLSSLGRLKGEEIHYGS